MNMVIVVVASLAIVFAQGIQHRVVGGGYMMDDAFFYKSLQGAVNGYPVKSFTGKFFNISMCQRTLTAYK